MTDGDKQETWKEGKVGGRTGGKQRKKVCDCEKSRESRKERKKRREEQRRLVIVQKAEREEGTKEGRKEGSRRMGKKQRTCVIVKH